MEIFSPRICRSSFFERPRRSVPSKTIFPSLIRAVSASSRRIDMEVTLLPLPDSPTIPRISPFFTEKLTPRTACTSPLLVINDVFRLSTVNISSILPLLFLQLRIQRIPQAVTHEIESEHDQTDDEGRKEQLMRTAS